MPHNMTIIKPTDVVLQENSQESSTYKAFQAKCASELFHSSQDDEEQNHHYKELIQDYQNHKPVYTELYNHANEHRRKEFASLPNLASHNAVTDTHIQEEGNRYNNVEMRPDRLSDISIASELFHSSQDDGEQHRHYKELTQDYQNNRPVYIELYNHVHEHAREEFASLPNAASRNAVSDTPIRQEGDCYSNIETRPNQSSDTSITYANLGKCYSNVKTRPDKPCNIKATMQI